MAVVVENASRHPRKKAKLAEVACVIVKVLRVILIVGTIACLLAFFLGLIRGLVVAAVVFAQWTLLLFCYSILLDVVAKAITRIVFGSGIAEGTSRGLRLSGLLFVLVALISIAFSEAASVLLTGSLSPVSFQFSGPGCFPPVGLWEELVSAQSRRDVPICGFDLSALILAVSFWGLSYIVDYGVKIQRDDEDVI